MCVYIYMCIHIYIYVDSLDRLTLRGFWGFGCKASLLWGFKSLKTWDPHPHGRSVL